MIRTHPKKRDQLQKHSYEYTIHCICKVRFAKLSPSRPGGSCHGNTTSDKWLKTRYLNMN